MASVQEIWRYPVKSMAGENLEATEVGQRGVAGDRAWAVRDEVRGGIRGAKKIAGLMKLAAEYPSPPSAEGSSPATIHFEDGSTGNTGDEEIHQRLSDALDHSVTLWPLVPVGDGSHYKRGAPESADMEKELRTIFAREPEEPLPDLGVFPPELLANECPPGTYFDAFPLLILTTNSLASMQAASADSRFDVRRFRPNLLIDDPESEDTFPESAWEGRRVRIGSAVLRMEMVCPRCVMVTRGFQELPADPKIMRSLVRENHGNLGLYARVEGAGQIHRGDTLEWLDTE
jgi:hypothetical protein